MRTLCLLMSLLIYSCSNAEIPTPRSAQNASARSIAQVDETPASDPTPTPTPTEPTVIIANEGGISLGQMMIENTAGLKLLKKTHRTGPMIKSSQTELISETQTSPNPRPQWTIIMKYTVVTLDCLGSDACEGEYEWIAVGTTISDGYTYRTTYTNTVTRRILGE